MCRVDGRPLAAVTAMLALLSSPDALLAAPSAPTSELRVVAALENITNLSRPGEDGYATVWDGDKYVQCRRLPDRNWRCEAAGTLMQISLAHVLTPDHIARLSALGWRLDPSFGNYAQIFPADVATSELADKILQVLREAYDVDTTQIEVGSAWLPSEPCPPRNGPTQPLAGVVSNAREMRSTAIHACSYKPPAELGPAAPVHPAAELIEF